jgi:hypothetical protein
LVGGEINQKEEDIWTIGIILVELSAKKHLFGSGVVDCLEDIVDYLGPINPEDIKGLDYEKAEKLNNKRVQVLYFNLL